jgi:hypothetical protein
MTLKNAEDELDRACRTMLDHCAGQHLMAKKIMQSVTALKAAMDETMDNMDETMDKMSRRLDELEGE